MHASTRTGGLLRRIVKLVYLPISPRLDTRIDRITPARSERSNRRNTTRTVPALFLLDLASRLSDLTGQPRPRHCAVTRAPSGACTVSRLSFTPEDESEPAIRTIGK